MTRYMIEYRERRRAAAREQLGGCCSVCASIESLEFDHIDPSTKTLAIGKMWHASKAKLAAELKKCQLLCQQHHLEKSRAEGSLGKGGRYERTKLVVAFVCEYCGTPGTKPKHRVRSANLFCDTMCANRWNNARRGQPTDGAGHRLENG